MWEWAQQTEPEILIALIIAAAIPAILIARFILYMILPKAWLKRWFSQ
jgi:nitrogen fixation/metabolism regulation signal transduction histidine kinase